MRVTFILLVSLAWVGAYLLSYLWHQVKVSVWEAMMPDRWYTYQGLVRLLGMRNNGDREGVLRAILRGLVRSRSLSTRLSPEGEKEWQRSS